MGRLRCPKGCTKLERENKQFIGDALFVYETVSFGDVCGDHTDDMCDALEFDTTYKCNNCGAEAEEIEDDEEEDATPFVQEEDAERATIEL